MYEYSRLGTHTSQWTVGVGLQDQRQVYTSNVVHVAHIYPHENFGSRTNINDIALMKLSKPVDITGRLVDSVYVYWI